MRCDHGNAVASAGRAPAIVGCGFQFETRKTNREPTKSGVIGLLAAALGLRRDDAAGLARLNGLHFAVRADREGSLLVDFHTANREEDRKKARLPM